MPYQGHYVLRLMIASGTFSVAYRVLADIFTPAERGSYVSALSLG